MIYKFKSKATGDLIMLGPQGNELLRLLGREAPAASGIVEVGDMAAALTSLQAAVAEHDAAVAAVAAVAAAESADADTPARSVGLRQRLWPFIEMLKRAQAAGEPIVWGV